MMWSRKSLSAKLKHLSGELRLLDELLKSETEVEPAFLREFREELDKVRLTAWVAGELMKAKHSKRCLEAVVSFVSAERLRQLERMVKDMCVDLDRKSAGFQHIGMESFFDSMQALHNEMVQRRRKYSSLECKTGTKNVVPN